MATMASPWARPLRFAPTPWSSHRPLGTPLAQRSFLCPQTLASVGALSRPTLRCPGLPSLPSALAMRRGL
eukprot:7461814-Lingulodinium_polyedra.AAC.1